MALAINSISIIYGALVNTFGMHKGFSHHSFLDCPLYFLFCLPCLLILHKLKSPGGIPVPLPFTEVGSKCRRYNTKEQNLWSWHKIHYSHRSSLRWSSKFLSLFFLSPSKGQRAAQARGGSIAHPESIWIFSECQQECQHLTVGALHCIMPGDIMAAAAKRNHDSQSSWPTRRSSSVGTR